MSSTLPTPPPVTAEARPARSRAWRRRGPEGPPRRAARRSARPGHAFLPSAGVRPATACASSLKIFFYPEFNPAPISEVGGRWFSFRRTLIEALVEALELAASVDRRRKGLAHLLLSLRSSSKVTNTGPHGRTAQFSDTTMPWLRLRGTSRSFTHTESNRPLPALSRERDRERERRGGKIRGNSLVVGDQLPRRFFRRACRSSSMPSPTGSASAACGCCCCCCWGCATWVAGTLASWVLRLIPISSKTC